MIEAHSGTNGTQKISNITIDNKNNSQQGNISKLDKNSVDSNDSLTDMDNKSNMDYAKGGHNVNEGKKDKISPSIETKGSNISMPHSPLSSTNESRTANEKNNLSNPSASTVNSSLDNFNSEKTNSEQTPGEKISNENMSAPEKQKDAQIDYTFIFNDDDDVGNESIKNDSFGMKKINEKKDRFSMLNNGNNVGNFINSMFSNENGQFQSNLNIDVTKLLEIPYSETWNFSNSDIQNVLEKVLLSYKNGNSLNLGSQEQQIWTVLEPLIKQKINKIKEIIKNENPELAENSTLFQSKLNSFTKNLSLLKENPKNNLTDFTMKQRTDQTNSISNDSMLKNNMEALSNQSGKHDQQSILKTLENNEGNKGDSVIKSSQNKPVIGHNFSSSFQKPSDINNGFNQNQIDLDAIVKKPASSDIFNSNNIDGNSNREKDHMNAQSKEKHGSNSIETNSKPTMPQSKELHKNTENFDVKVSIPKVSADGNKSDKNQVDITGSPSLPGKKN
jgi:hypothetical protein